MFLCSQACSVEVMKRRGVSFSTFSK
jgi:hypothetical protein